MRHSAAQMTAYVEHCGGKIHTSGGGHGEKLMFDHFGFEKPSSTSNVDDKTFNELGLVAYRGKAEIF